jgi:hypothetical protein
VSTVVNLRVPQYAGKFLSGSTTGGLSTRALLYEVDENIHYNGVKVKVLN